MERDADYTSHTGAVYIDQYCNPLSDISLRDIQAQIHNIVELVCKTLRGINSRHPSLTFRAGAELSEMGWAAGALGVVSYLMMGSTNATLAPSEAGRHLPVTACLGVCLLMLVTQEISVLQVSPL